MKCLAERVLITKEFTDISLMEDDNASWFDLAAVVSGRGGDAKADGQVRHVVDDHTLISAPTQTHHKNSTSYL
jgi:hypothetical protein